MSQSTLRFTLYALVLIVLSGCALQYRNLSPPTISVVGVSTPGITADMGIDLLASLRISNPNKVGLPVRGGELRLILNDITVGTANIDDGFQLPAAGSTIIELPARISLGQAIDVGLTALRSNAPSVDYRLTGYVDLGISLLGRVAVNESGRVELQAR